MPRYDFRAPRLFLDAPLAAGATVPLGREAANYLRNVLRLKTGNEVLVFNGRDGEWRAVLGGEGKAVSVTPAEQVRPQGAAADLHYLFAPIKHARLDYMVQKAVELGVAKLQPVLTQHTQVTRVNLERMRANAIEAAEQCGVLAIPDIGEPAKLDAMLGALEPERVLIFCDEEADIADPVAALRPAEGKPLAVLIGPEGGFSAKERAMLLARTPILRLPLGPRILRADTAAVSALTLVQSVAGDWKE